jgi:iron complex outermembrane recepter protein
MKQKHRPVPARLTVHPLAAAVAAALGCSYGTGVFAQNPIEEIIVTAQRRENTAQDVPINITAIAGRTLADQRLVGLEEISRIVPGLQVSDKGPRDEFTDVIVRGLNTSSVGPTFSGGTVATYLGEIPLDVDLKTNDLERVEVLIGPQGTLYGSGTLAGAIRYIPVRPRNELEAEVHGTVFSLDESDSLGSDVGFVVNVPLVDDRWAFRATVDILDDPGYIDYPFVVREGGVSNPQPDLTNPADVAANLRRVADANGEETVSGRLALRWTPSDTVDADLTYYYQDVEAEGRSIANVEAFGTGRYEAGYRYEEPNHYKSELLSLEVTADLGFAELTSATGVSDYSELGQRDQTDLLLNFEYLYETFPSFSAFTREEKSEDTLAQELRLVSLGSGPLSWIGGVYYHKYKQAWSSREFTPRFDQWAVDNLGGVQLRPDALEYIELHEQETTEMALYGELSYAFSDDWEITIGARLYKFDDSASGGFALPLYDTVYLGYPQDLIDPSIESNRIDDEGSLFKLNVAHNFNDDVLGYATVSEGYRIGGVNPVTSCTAADIANPSQALCALPDELLVRPDTTTNYELGVHSTLADGSWILNAAVYYIDWNDIQVDDQTLNGSINITSNGGGAESKGLEVSTRYRVTRNWELSATYAYNHAELSDPTDALLGSRETGPLLTPAGTRLPGSPQHQGSFGFAYSTMLGNRLSLDIRYGLVYMGDILNSLGAEEVPSVLPYHGEKLPSYTLHSISAKLSRDQWSATFYVDNLTDEYAISATRESRRLLEQYRHFSQAPNNTSGFLLRSYGQYVGRPRTAGVSFTYLF